MLKTLPSASSQPQQPSTSNLLLLMLMVHKPTHHCPSSLPYKGVYAPECTPFWLLPPICEGLCKILLLFTLCMATHILYICTADEDFLSKMAEQQDRTGRSGHLTFPRWAGGVGAGFVTRASFAAVLQYRPPITKAVVLQLATAPPPPPRGAGLSKLPGLLWVPCPALLCNILQGSTCADWQSNI